MAEKNFSYEIGQTLKKHGLYTHKISDTPRMLNTAKVIELVKRSLAKAFAYFTENIKECYIGFAHKKPFDRIAILDGSIIAIEEKQSTSNSYSLTHMRQDQKHQIEILSKIKADRAYYVVNFKFDRIIEKEKKHVNVVVVFTPQEMRKILDSDMPSIKFMDKEHKPIYDYYKKIDGMWDLPFLRIPNV